MSDESNPAEKPVNDGGGTAPQPDPEPDGQEASAAGAEKPVNQGGSGT
jgi:hypothetical protein